MDQFATSPIKNPYLQTTQQLPIEIRAHLMHVEHNTVHISSLEWGEIRMEKYVDKVVMWKVADRLNLSFRWLKQIMASIAHINFPLLKMLNLEYNVIFSIEILNQIRLPILQHLNLNNNNITHVRNLRKCNFPCLNKLLISGNKIVEWKGMSQLGSCQLREIVVENDNISRVQGYDPHWFIKMQPYGIFQLFGAKSSKRIKMPSFQAQLTKKYPYIAPS